MGKCMPTAHFVTTQTVSIVKASLKKEEVPVWELCHHVYCDWERVLQGGRQVCQKFDELEDISCITDHPGFHPVCLNLHVLETAYYQYQQQYGGRHKTDEQRNRYKAYRQFARWCWGYLGRRVRVPLPSCVINTIHQRFPSPTYTGFKKSGEPTEI